MGQLALTLIIFLFLAGRMCYRAYYAYSNGSGNWPILAGLALVYILCGAAWRFLGFETTIFWGISIVALFASQMIHATNRRNY